MLAKSTDECGELLQKYMFKKIKDIRVRGDAVFLRKEAIEAAVYNRLERLDEADRDYWSRFENITDDFEFVRHTVTEGEIIFYFEDNSSVGLFYTDGGIVISADTGFIHESNFRPALFFEQCMGKSLVGIEGDTDGLFLRFDSGHKMRLGSLLNFCSVSLYGKNGKILPITFARLKECLIP